MCKLRNREIKVNILKSDHSLGVVPSMPLGKSYLRQVGMDFFDRAKQLQPQLSQWEL